MRFELIAALFAALALVASAYPTDPEPGSWSIDPFDPLNNEPAIYIGAPLLLPLDLQNTTTSDPHLQGSTDVSHAKRGQQYGAYCWPKDKFPYDMDDVQEAVDRTRNLPGEPFLEGRKCARITCMQGVSIWWCNEAEEPRHLYGYKLIAEKAMTVVEGCVRSYGVIGGVFQHMGFNIQVKQLKTCRMRPP
ncbi:hypothetical protein BJX64DRAFT_292538 [Aspergillus heterothallicus]